MKDMKEKPFKSIVHQV